MEDTKKDLNHTSREKNYNGRLNIDKKILVNLKA